MDAAALGAQPGSAPLPQVLWCPERSSLCLRMHATATPALLHRASERQSRPDRKKPKGAVHHSRSLLPRMWWGIGCLPCGGVDLRPTSPSSSPPPGQLFSVAALGCSGVKQIKVAYALVNAALCASSCSSATCCIQATQGLFPFHLQPQVGTTTSEHPRPPRVLAVKGLHHLC